MCACNDVLTVGNQAALSELRRCQQAEAERSLARELGCMAQAITARAYSRIGNSYRTVLEYP